MVFVPKLYKCRKNPSIMSSIDQPLQEQPQPSFQSIALRYGIIAVLLLVMVDLVSRLTGFIDPSNPETNINGFLLFPINWIIMIGSFFFAVKKHRDEDLGGFITFGRGFRLSLIAGLVVVGITLLWTFVYLQFVDPGILEISREVAEAQMEEQGVDPESMSGWLDMSTSLPFVLGSVAVFRFLGTLLCGLIAAGVASKNPQEA